MPEARTWVLAAIVIAHVGVLRSWSSVFWSSLEPWLRKKVGVRWGVELDRERADKRRAWAVRGHDGPLPLGVACASAIVLTLGLILPALLVAAATALGLVMSPLGPLLLVETVALTPVLWAWSIQSSA
jgi:hypothetical protein